MNTIAEVTERCPWCGSAISHAKFLEVEARIRDQEKKKLAEVEAEMRKQLGEKFQRDLASEKRALEQAVKEEAAKQVGSITADRDRIATKLKEAEGREAAIRKQVQDEASKQLEAQRDSLTKDRDLALLKERSGFARERESWDKKIKELERQLQRKASQDLGDGAEIDLFEALRGEFPGDKIERVKKGQPGADIIHEVLYKGESCGRIVIDSKNRQGWQNAFVTKLRQDQTEASAEHAILATTVFPTGRKELCIESDVIVVNPARACHVIRLLRRTMITVHVRGLSLQQRATKMSRLYGFITSDAYAQRLAEVAKLTSEILDLDVHEKKAHDNVWKKRGAMATRIHHVLRDIDTDVAGIVEGRDDEQLPAAS